VCFQKKYLKSEMIEKEFGGYLPLEITRDGNEYYQSNKSFSVISLNSGRSSFYFAAKRTKMSKIYLPIFNCERISDPFKKLGIEVEYYKLDDSLLPKDVNPSQEEFILWTNYYGNATTKQINLIKNKYKNLIIDNCHAFFSKPLKGVYNCYSTRKFFGVSDGAYLIKDNFKFDKEIDIDISYKNAKHLMIQLDIGTNNGYEDHLKNEEHLNNNYLKMSKLTKKILQSINYKKILDIRRRNFLKMHYFLGKINEFPINLESNTHIYYPFFIKDKDLRFKLIDKKLFNPFWWKHVIELTEPSDIENKLSKYTVMLPIDQRYSLEDIKEIANIVKKNIKVN